MKFEILKFKSVTSTNDVAVNLIKEKKKLTGCVCSELQTKGRGTYGKKWISEKGNLFLTLFFPLDLQVVIVMKMYLVKTLKHLFPLVVVKRKSIIMIR